jgi:hypothetical protein
MQQVLFGKSSIIWHLRVNRFTRARAEFQIQLFRSKQRPQWARHGGLLTFARDAFWNRSRRTVHSFPVRR